MGLVRDFLFLRRVARPLWRSCESRLAALARGEEAILRAPMTEARAWFREVEGNLSAAFPGGIAEALRTAGLMVLRPPLVAAYKSHFAEIAFPPIEVAVTAVIPDSALIRSPQREEFTLRHRELLGALNARLPDAAAALVLEIVDPQLLLDWIESRRLLSEVRKAAGEERAGRLRLWIAHLGSTVHQRYVETLFLCERILAGADVPTQFPAYGNLVNFLCESTRPTRGLVYPEAAHLRNGASHAGGWTVALDPVRVAVNDRDWLRTHSIDELEAIGTRMFAESTGFWIALYEELNRISASVLAHTDGLELVGALLRKEADGGGLEERVARQISQRFAHLSQYFDKIPGMRVRRLSARAKLR